MTGASGFIRRALLKELKLNYGICAPLHQEINLLSDTIALDALVKKRHIGTFVHLGAPAVINTNQSLSEYLVDAKECFGCLQGKQDTASFSKFLGNLFGL